MTIMKAVVMGGALVVALIGVIIWEETRIAELRSAAAAMKEEPAEVPGKDGAARRLPKLAAADATARSRARPTTGVLSAPLTTIRTSCGSTASSPGSRARAPAIPAPAIRRFFNAR